MDKKVDLSELVGGSPQNSLTGRAPLAPGFGSEEVAEKTPENTENPGITVVSAEKVERAYKEAIAQPEVPYSDLNIESNAPITEQPLVTVDADGEPSGVLVPPSTALVEATAEAVELTEVAKLAKIIADLTKRLEDFGAIPRQEDLKPHVPVVTVTKAGNVRTDW